MTMRVTAMMTQEQREKMEDLHRRVQSLIIDVKDLEYKDLGSYEEIGDELFKLQLEITKLWDGMDFHLHGPLDPELQF